MRRPTEFLPRRVPRRLGRLFSAPAMLMLIAMALGAGGQSPRPLGWPGSAPGGPTAMLRFSGPAHGPYLVISAQNLRDIRAVAPRLAATLLARRTTIVLSPGSPASTGKQAALGTAFFTSYAGFIGRLQRHAATVMR